MISLLFLILNSLNKEIKKLPLRSISGQNSNMISNSEVITIGIFLSPEQYSTLRSILSLTGDVYNLCKSLLKSQNLMDLKESIENIFENANKFRKLRNFFTHIGEIIINKRKHGIDGPINSPSGLKYTKESKDNIHLI